MNPERSFGDDVLTAAIAFSVGALAGFVVTWAVGGLTFLLAENGCSGEYLCSLDSALWAILIGAGCGLLAFIAVACHALFNRCRPGERLRAGLLTFAAAPLVVMLAFPLILGRF